MSAAAPVGILGARSPVGRALLLQLAESGRPARAYTRATPPPDAGPVAWRRLALPRPAERPAPLPHWICLAPVWTLEEWLPLLAASGAERVVALSSTSVLTKADSPDPAERDTVRRLLQGEAALRAWADAQGIGWTILRPTMIYGHGDKNIQVIARFIDRFGFFPLVTPGTGLRQPVHAEDVAAACLAALGADAAWGRTYTLGGAEVLTYREMVTRMFQAAHRRPRFAMVPPWAVAAMLRLVRRLPRYRHWSTAMAGRVNVDLAFDIGEAQADLAFAPRPFTPPGLAEQEGALQRGAQAGGA